MANNESQYAFRRVLDWEDAQAVLDVSSTVHGPVASIGGAGDIALSFMTSLSSSLTVLCSGESEKMLIELKMKAIQNLHPDKEQLKQKYIKW